MIKKEALKHVRRKRELNHMKRIASSNLFSSPVERAALSSLYNKDLKAAVQVLDNKHHDEYEALKKRIVEEKTNAEIAEETTTNPITVRTRIHKALRKHLRGELAEKWSKKHVDELAWGLIYAEDAFENEENGRSSHEDT